MLSRLRAGAYRRHTENRTRLTTPRCLDWQHEPNRTGPDANPSPTAPENPGAACRTRLPGWLPRGGAGQISLRDDGPRWVGGVVPRNGHGGAGTPAPSREQLGAVSWPADGVSAADISGIGVTDGPGATRQVPITSVAKLMTAYVVLQDPPLPRGGPGPGHHGRAVGGSRIPSQARDGDSLVAVAAGRRSPGAMRWRRCCCRRPTT
jgi:hypothetical protein